MRYHVAFIVLAGAACSRSRAETPPPLPTPVVAAASALSSAPAPASPSAALDAGDGGPAPDAVEAPRAGSPIVPRLSVSTPADPSTYNWSLTAENLPAVSADGNHAVVVVDVQDGLRGYPSNELLFLAVDTDKVEKRLPLLVADEFATLSSPPTSASGARGPETEALARKIGARLEKARTELAKTSWVALARTRSTWQPAKMRYEWGPVGGVAVSLDSGRLRVRDASAAALLDRDVRAWKVASYKIRDFGPCVFEPGLTHLAVDTTRRVLVVVSQTVMGGPDFCEGPIVAHAYRLTP